jgi:acyl carrier protein
LVKVMNHALGTNIDEGGLARVRRLDELVGFDSLTLVEWVAALEEEFQVTLPSERLRLEFLVDLDGVVDYMINATTAPGRQP